MDLGSLLASYIAISGAHAGNHLSEANRTGAPARMNWSRGTEEWRRPDREYQFRHWQMGDDDNPILRVSQKADGSRFGASLYTGVPVATPEEAQRHGAGFAGQDVVNNALNTPESNLANALYKGLYLAGITAAGKSTDYKDGDIGGIAANAGLKPWQVKAGVGLTAIADLIKSQQDNPQWGLRTEMRDGTPALIWDYKF